MTWSTVEQVVQPDTVRGLLGKKQPATGVITVEDSSETGTDLLLGTGDTPLAAESGAQPDEHGGVICCLRENPLVFFLREIKV